MSQSLTMGNKTTDDELVIPTWLNSEFLSEVLSKEHSKDISLLDYSIKAAVPKGSNYLSILYRIIAEDTSAKKYHLVVKTLPAGEFLQNFLSELKGFEKEECMYKKVLPAIYKIMKSATGRIHPLSARCLPCPVEKVIVLEDMKPLGYQMANRHNGLDLEHCKVSVRALARFHAYSLELHRIDPEIMNNYEETWLVLNEEKREERDKNVELNMNKLVSQIKTWPGFEHYAEKVMKYRHTATEIMAKAVERKEDSLNVLNHGDFWTNNMMFLYNKDNGNVEDVRFVDFQMGRFSSPALDLQYFMCNCPSNEVRFTHRETLLEEYHAEFVDTLEILKLDPNMLSLQQLKDEFAEKDIFGLMMSIFVLMVIVAQERDAPDFKEIKQEDILVMEETPLADAYAGERRSNDLIIPTWLSNHLLSEVLSKENDKAISVKNFSAMAAVPKGSNYLSTLYRVVAEDKSSIKYYLIIKTLPSGEHVQQFLTELKGFEKEECMYTKVFPAIYKIMKSATGKIRPLSARCLPCSVEDVLVLEDMKHLGYQMANRHNGLDLDHCKITVRALARFHVYSLELYKMNPEIMDAYEETLYTIHEERRAQRERHMELNIKKLATEIEGWPGYERFAEKIKKLIPGSIDRMAEYVRPKRDSLNVLNHGDCWTNNMMFIYNKENGKVEDVRFVDFQIARFSSPALDLQYLMCNCPNDEVRLFHRDTLLEEYHSEFCETLKDLNQDPNILTLQQLKDEFAEKDMFGLYTLLTVLVVIVAEESAAPDLEKVKNEDGELNEETPMSDAYAGKRYREILQKMLPFYEKKGLL
ncbi:hypothetical protein C0J52_25883 [Blattella germanica]|nr:hypothetical protein C0J52_25883 [Blattella germanica]